MVSIGWLRTLGVSMITRLMMPTPSLALRIYYKNRGIVKFGVCSTLRTAITRCP